jgi:hypothetical protein
VDAPEDRILKQRPSPERYEVTIRDLAGETWTYNVATWMGEPKAVALAVQRHLATSGREEIYAVEARLVGPRDRRGRTTIEPSDLVDRAEF